MQVQILRIVFFLTVWWICSGVAEPFFAAAGFFSIWLSLFIADRLGLFTGTSFFEKPFAFLLYVSWLIKEIFFAALGVTRLIWQVRPKPSARLSTISTALADETALMLYGNSITLTPGTICADIVKDNDVYSLRVHALEKSGIADLKTGRMEKVLTRIGLGILPTTKEAEDAAV